MKIRSLLENWKLNWKLNYVSEFGRLHKKMDSIFLLARFRFSQIAWALHRLKLLYLGCPHPPSIPHNPISYFLSVAYTSLRNDVGENC